MTHRYKAEARSLMKNADKYLKKDKKHRALKLVRLAHSLDPENGRARSKYHRLVEKERVATKVHLAAAGPMLDDDAENLAAVEQYIMDLTETPKKTGGVPKQVWMYWDSGFENAPDIVKQCYQTWEKLNPDYKITFIDKDNLDEHLGFNFTHAMQSFSVGLEVAGQSDFIRMALLARHGGVWADATTFCLRPLNEWLDEATAPAGFFCFRQRPDLAMQDRTFISWFLAAEPGNIITLRVLRKSFEFLTKPRELTLIKTGQKHLRENLAPLDPPEVNMSTTGQELIDFADDHGFYLYFWMFYLFNDVVSDPDVAPLWEQITQQTNRRAKIDVPITTFRDSYVSKQTYKRTYLETENYAKRTAYVNKLLEQY